MSDRRSHVAANGGVSEREGQIMAADGKVAALSSVKLFSECSKRELRTIAGLCTDAKVDEGFVLTTQGSLGVECFVVADGEAAVQIDGHTVAIVGAGDCVGELALLDGGRRTATVVSRTPMKLYVMTSPEFRALLETSTDISRKILVSLADRLRQAEAGRVQ
jgi:CRP-like cAMP-binding protein